MNASLAWLAVPRPTSGCEREPGSQDQLYRSQSAQGATSSLGALRSYAQFRSMLDQLAAICEEEPFKGSFNTIKVEHHLAHIVSAYYLSPFETVTAGFSYDAFRRLRIGDGGTLDRAVAGRMPDRLFIGLTQCPTAGGDVQGFSVSVHRGARGWRRSKCILRCTGSDRRQPAFRGRECPFPSCARGWTTETADPTHGNCRFPR